MKRHNILFPINGHKAAPAPGRQNPVPRTPQREQDPEPEPDRPPRRKKKSIYEIVME